MPTVDLAELLTGEAASSELLRLVTCGSVDDGKSTLIGRLLYDTKQVMSDQLEHVEETSERRGDGYVNLALLTDGLRAEREQGITIDVAYRSFVTPTRRFQLADAPGHVQYTRNMVTGASTADVAVVLLDARKGVIEQTRRHAYDRVAARDPPRRVRRQQDGPRRLRRGALPRDRAELRELSERLELRDELAIPIAALPATTSSSPPSGCRGGTAAPSSSVSRRSRSRPTATRPTAASRCSGSSGRCPTSTTTTAATRVRSPAANGGRVTTSSCSVGAADDRRRGRDARRPARRRGAGSVGRRPTRGRTSTSHAATCSCDPADPPVAARELEATVCWMSERPVADGRRLAVKHTTRWSRAILDEVSSKLDVETLDAGAGRRPRS